MHFQISKKYSHVDLVHMIDGVDLERGANVAGSFSLSLTHTVSHDMAERITLSLVQAAEVISLLDLVFT